jgi:xanthine dehydrogenase accessory factor
VRDVWQTLLDAAAAGERVALATVVGVDGSAPRAAGARMVVWPDGRIVGTVGGGNFEHRVIAEAIAALEAGRPRRYAVHLTRDLGMCCGGAMEVYIEPMDADEHLVIYGAGHVAVPTAAVARLLGFRVTVVDERDELLTPDRFPDVDRVLAHPLTHATALRTDARTYVFVTTHAHALDQALLETLIAREWAWFGMIGSRAKLAKFFIRLRAAGVDEALFTKVNGPVGLDIGAETPAEIAVSVAAELVRVRRGSTRPPLSLAEIPLPARGGDGIAHPPGNARPGPARG